MTVYGPPPTEAGRFKQGPGSLSFAGKIVPAIRTSVTLRTGRSADADALAALERRVFTHDRLSRRSLVRFLARPSALLLVADRGNLVCGYALVLFRSSSRLARLYSIATMPELSGHGIGTKLLQAAERAARRRGCTAMRLEVRTDNASARHLYEKSGYKLIGQLAAYYQDGGEALRLEKRLASPEH